MLHCNTSTSRLLCSIWFNEMCDRFCRGFTIYSHEWPQVLLHNWNPSKFVAKACNIIIFANPNRPSAIKWNLYGILQSRSRTSTYFRHEKSIFGLWIWARLIARLKFPLICSKTVQWILPAETEFCWFCGCIPSSDWRDGVFTLSTNHDTGQQLSNLQALVEMSQQCNWQKWPMYTA